MKCLQMRIVRIKVRLMPPPPSAICRSPTQEVPEASAQPPVPAGQGTRASSAARAPLRLQEPPPRLGSAQIMGGRDEIEIEHRGALYRLRVTSLGKLILTK